MNSLEEVKVAYEKLVTQFELMKNAADDAHDLTAASQKAARDAQNKVKDSDIVFGRIKITLLDGSLDNREKIIKLQGLLKVTPTPEFTPEQNAILDKDVRPPVQ